MTEITAIRFAEYGSADVLSADRIEAPTPGPGEVVVGVRAVSVNPIDWKVRSGAMSAVMPTAFPAITGRDGAGVIAAVGDGVDAGRVGERVCFLAGRGVGTWAEQIVLPAEFAVPIPDSLSFADAASLPLAGLSAWIPLVATAEVGPDMRVLVHAAAGGVGSLGVQIAHARGAWVAGTCSARNADFVRALGASEAIAYDQGAFEDQLTDIDVVFDTVGGDVHRRSYSVMKKGGTMVCLSAEPYEDRGAEFGVRVVKPMVQPDPEALAALVALVAEGRIRTVVEHVMPFSDFAAAQVHSEGGHARGKTVLEIGA
ncbi:NADPH:quinone reductase-like Zn-dependent oxidoreductase [Amorphus suaedae]